ncbi:hypothetical protein [Altericroceibacterium spongiae]|uniref:hypothetical protein n=1 Tax=Altericroceibacterium spongiae TaxID=2320269 RepID=UPI001600AA40|nr:hypothetical protein [Altericroceibacterium spongiae]
MSGSWVSIIWLAGALVLAMSALRSHRMNARKGITMALIWVAIFFVAAAFFGALG